ncbi:ribosome biogenesis GTP-binding protein YihA/YsxC [Candidatus Ichthyocystis hellenicum]|uniref:ribosome biogenesis GTP-binding protein YihA/YsxC n=1 Tax=Candidatus Ichthyocystis hellenicum TaxID=1561003 RepID=UPI000AF7C7FA|nr:ribosome biogenesis GTP-binding protein YihA/YsxC [Candidatus Ichthyocystis hellenicum]
MIHGIDYFSTVVRREDLPNFLLPEVAIVGRSNCGKSTLINLLASRRRLAYSSKTPGCTRTLNFFLIPEKGFLVDLPGYGFSKVARSEKNLWARFIEDYLLTRSNLSGLILLLDIRREVTALDEKFILWFAQTGVPIHIVLSKSDKFSSSQCRRVSENVKNYVATKLIGVNILPTFSLISSLRRTGIDSLTNVIRSWL